MMRVFPDVGMRYPTAAEIEAVERRARRMRAKILQDYLRRFSEWLIGLSKGKTAHGATVPVAYPCVGLPTLDGRCAAR